MANDESNRENAWYCVRSKPKSEHLAAAHLARQGGFEVFCPRIRFEKATRRGKVWFVEALFPGYLFARFDLMKDLRLVQATSAVVGVLHFRDFYPVLSPKTIEELRLEIGNDEPKTVEGSIREGDEVLVTEGVMSGLVALVTNFVPGTERIRILLEMLGEEREADIALKSVVHAGDVRPSLGSGSD